MDEIFLRFPHLDEQIFEKIDNKSLTNSRVVQRYWRDFIDENDYHWRTRIKDVVTSLNKKLGIYASTGYHCETAFHLACQSGYAKIAEMIMKKSVEFNIDLNAKNYDGDTTFHFACLWGETSIVDMMINNSESVNLDLTARNNYGQTGFQLAEMMKRFDVIKLIKSKMPSITFWSLDME